jgi:hypothetical protein
MKVARQVTVAADPFEMDVRNDGVVFLSGGSGKQSEVTIVDLNEAEPVVAHWKGLPSGAVVRLSADEKHLYLSHWRAAPAAMSSWPLPEKLAASDTPRGATVPVPVQRVRGEVTPSPDGRFLLCEAGVVFLTRDPTQN